MATEPEHRLAQARVALQDAARGGTDLQVLQALELAYMAAVLDAQDACAASPP